MELFVRFSRMIRGIVSLCLLSTACMPPGQADRDAEMKRLMQAKTVHFPPKVESCLGVTLRLSDERAPSEKERLEFASRLSPAEIENTLRSSGFSSCETHYRDVLNDTGGAFEPLFLRVAYGVDPEGKVCAIVERDRTEPFDPAIAPLIDASAECVKNSLFAAEFPKARVDGRERIVLFLNLKVDKAVSSSTVASPAAR